MVYSRTVDGRVYTLGVSGRLYKSNVLMYDHQTESLWSQLMEKAIAGALAGKELEKMPSIRTEWGNWRQQHPNARVLSTETGYRRDYGRDPYKDYYRASGTMFPVGDVRKDLSPKEMVLGLETGRSAKAYALSDLKEKSGTVQDTLGGSKISIEISPDGKVKNVRDGEGNPLAPIYSYWFAWQAFHPETKVYRPGD